MGVVVLVYCFGIDCVRVFYEFVYCVLIVGFLLMKCLVEVCYLFRWLAEWLLIVRFVCVFVFD